MRVSTTEQSEEGKSLSTQEDRIRVYVEQHQMHLHALGQDVGSGQVASIADRELSQIITVAKEKGYPLICTSVDRLGRNSALLKREILDNGIRVIEIDTGRELTPSEFKKKAAEAQRTALRISRDMRKAAGVSPNQRSPGARKGGLARAAQLEEQRIDHAIVVAEEMQRIEREAKRSLSDSAMARALNASGRVQPFRNQGKAGAKLWYPASVKRVRKLGVAFR
jgi:DNA invertase Pin-like site-specific DNA recombinase